MDREGQLYLDSFEKRWSVSPPDNELSRPATLDLMKKEEELSLKVTKDFSSSAAAKLLEQEIGEVVSLVFFKRLVYLLHFVLFRNNYPCKCR